VISTQKQPSCKKHVALFKMASAKKVVNQRGWPRNGCDGRLMEKNNNNNNSGEADS